jgi:hypothetical protein
MRNFAKNINTWLNTQTSLSLSLLSLRVRFSLNNFLKLMKFWRVWRTKFSNFWNFARILFSYKFWEFEDFWLKLLGETFEELNSSNFWNFQRILFSYIQVLRLWRFCSYTFFWDFEGFESHNLWDFGKKKILKLMKFLGIVYYTSYQTFNNFFLKLQKFLKYLLLKLLKLWTIFWNQSSETLKIFFLKFNFQTSETF